MTPSQNAGESRQPTRPSATRNRLKSLVEISLPQTPAQFARHLCIDKWGSHIDPYTARLVTLDYDYNGHPPQNGVHQGQVASSMLLIDALLADYQTVGDGRFGETGFGLYTPPSVGPSIKLVDHVDEFANHGSGNHKTYEGIYRRTNPQAYQPLTQIRLRPADFKQWVWTLELKSLYRAYLERSWPSDSAITASQMYPLRTSVKAAFVMSAWLQHQESSLSQHGLELALEAAGLLAKQTWEGLTVRQLQAPTRETGAVIASRLQLYRYTATDIWTFRLHKDSRILLYIPGNSSPLHEFADARQLQQWVAMQGRSDETRRTLAAHFAPDDRDDGTFHAGVMTALEGMAAFPAKHWLGKTAGRFNDDGYWDPADYVGFEHVNEPVDPFAQLVLTMKREAQKGVDSIKDDAQVNRDNLSAFVEPLVQWINRFGPLALFVPGGEGFLALAGLIDAGYGLDQTLNGTTSSERSEGLTRTVFGLLNALPLVIPAATETAQAGRDAEVLVAQEKSPEVIDAVDKPASNPVDEPLNIALQHPLPETASRLRLLKGIGPSVEHLSDETLTAIGRVSTVDDDMLRLMHRGRAPTPLLADTISRFRIDQDLTSIAPGAKRTELFNSRYQALQRTDNAWVSLFQRQYPGLPNSAVEQILDRYGVDLLSVPEPAEARRLFSRLDAKARQYQQHVRLNRAYEGLYLRSMAPGEADILGLHSLPGLSGWPKGLRIEVLDGSLNGALLDRCGPLQSTDVRRLIRTDNGYSVPRLSEAKPLNDAVFSLLTEQERTALQVDSAQALQRLINERALSRTDLMTGLSRMDAGLAFEPQGLRGGSVGPVVSTDLLMQQTARTQLQDIYPQLSDVDADAQIHEWGDGALAQVDHLRQQLQQLISDLAGWIDRVSDDVADMEVELLNPGEAAARGMNQQQIDLHNAREVQAAMREEQENRALLGAKLMAIWRKHPPFVNHVFEDGQLTGYRIDLEFAQYHRLPMLNIKFHEVIELSLTRLQIADLRSLNNFLDSFPNLRTLDMEGVDLSEFRAYNSEGQLIRALPESITRMRDMTSLNLSLCDLTFNDNAASQLVGLTRLQELDLSENPLSVPPLLSGLNDLRRLNLRNTLITRCPIGLPDTPLMTLLDLRDNDITRLPQSVIDQGIASRRVRLDGNPLTDEDTLRRLITHREQTGVNLWLSKPGIGFGEVEGWLRDLEAPARASRLAIWQRLAARDEGPRFLRALDGVSLSPDYWVNYAEIQARVWRLLHEADISQELWQRLIRDVEVAEADADNPMIIFTALENRVRLYRDWEAMGRPFPLEAN